MKKNEPFRKLMDVVCVEWGFCGGAKNGKFLHVTDLVPHAGKVTADQFVEWVFLADGMNPNSEPEKWQRHKDAIRSAFVLHMGGETVSAERLRYEIE